MHHSKTFGHGAIGSLDADGVDTRSQAGGADDHAVFATTLHHDDLTHGIADGDLLQAFCLNTHQSVGGIRIHLIAFFDVFAYRSHLDVDIVGLVIGPSGRRLAIATESGHLIVIAACIGHVEILVEGKKLRGQLVSVDEDTFSVDIEEKVALEGKKRKETRIITHTWRYDEPKYVRYDLRF